MGVIWNNVIMITLAVSFIIVVLNKWEIFDWLQAKWNWKKCFFCYGFWLSFFIILIIEVIKNYPLISFYPLYEALFNSALATPLIAFLTYVITVNDNGSN